MTSRIVLPNTNLNIYPLCLGGNVFGWTANKEQSFQVLDAFVELGGNFIDTADVYSEWAPGNSGGESEAILGEWMTSRGNRDEMVIATKVAKLSTRAGLSRANIFGAIDDSLRRLQTDYVDLYYAHEEDNSVALEETLGAFDELVKAGKVRHLGASQHSAKRLAESLDLSEANGWAKYAVLQNQYNLVERKEFEADSIPVLEKTGLTALPFFSLAMGFLSGKYRPGAVVDSVRAGGVEKYQNAQGWAVVAALGEIAAELNTTDSAVALAWLRAQPTVSAPIASARTVEQMHQIMPIVELNAAQLAKLDSASA
jgi:aryl-alcohol dehydrogenase-like predicted oxidoreductase